jgi:hypothetical protein
MAQDVFSADLVVKHVEAKGGLRLRLAIELSLKGRDLFRRCQAHRQSPSPHHRQKRTRSQGPLLRRHYTASCSYDPVRLPLWSPPVATLRPLPSPSTGLPRLLEPPFRRAVPTTRRRIRRVHMSIAVRFRSHCWLPSCSPESENSRCKAAVLLYFLSPAEPPKGPG